MSFPIIILLVVCILLPLFCTVQLLRLTETSQFGWLIGAADSTVVVVLIFLVGRWDIAGYYTRFVLIGLFVAALLWSLRGHLSRPWRPANGLLPSHWYRIVSLALFSAALFYVLSGLLPPTSARALSFPLDRGRFVAAQAGGVTLLNHHADHPAQRFAADFTEIFPTGFRVRGILPKDLEAYAIFGASVVSPCAGDVIAVRSDLPDLIPPERDWENLRGNHVILDCGDLQVELAHFQQGHVAVEVGDRVSVGDPLGKVGNSGNTTEPHLHIHAFDPATGHGVPMAFDGRSPTRNRLFRR